MSDMSVFCAEFPALNVRFYIEILINYELYLKSDILSRVAATNAENSLTFVQFTIDEIMSMDIFPLEGLLAFEMRIMGH